MLTVAFDILVADILRPRSAISKAKREMALTRLRWSWSILGGTRLAMCFFDAADGDGGIRRRSRWRFSDVLTSAETRLTSSEMNSARVFSVVIESVPGSIFNRQRTHLLACIPNVLSSSTKAALWRAGVTATYILAADFSTWLRLPDASHDAACCEGKSIHGRRSALSPRRNSSRHKDHTWSWRNIVTHGARRPPSRRSRRRSQRGTRPRDRS